MQIVKILHVFIAVLLLTAILCPTSILVHVINDNKQTSTTFINNNHHQEHYIDNTTITTSTKTTTLFILEEHSTSHHRVRRNIHDPLSNPWLHSKQELLELLWKRGNELHKDENDNENIEQDDDHQTSLSTLNEQQHHQPSSQHHNNKHLTMVGASLNHNKKQNNKRMNNNKSDQLLVGKSIDCCPSVLEMVEPHGGTNINGTYVELYQDGSVKQRFYELSCDRYVEGKPCLFMDRKLYNISKCVQKYSYSYALVRENVKTTTSSSTISSTTSRHHNHRHNNNFNSGSGSGWMLDYIRVRSGCSCEVTPVIYKKKRTNNKHKKNKIKKHG